MRSRSRSIRFKLIGLLLAPLISLIALWVFAASLTLGDGLNLLHVDRLSSDIGYPAGALGNAFEQERRATMVYLGDPSAATKARLDSVRIITNQQESLFRRTATDKSALNDASAGTRKQVAHVVTLLGKLSITRRAIDGRDIRRPKAYDTYNSLVDSTINLQESLSTLSDPQVAEDARTQVALTRATNELSEEDALLAGSIAAGRLSKSERQQFTELVGIHHYLHMQAKDNLSVAGRAYMQSIMSSPQYMRLEMLEHRVTGKVTGHRPPVTDTMWKTTANAVLTKYRGLQLATAAEAQRHSGPVARQIIYKVSGAGALGLLAVVLSVVLSALVLRSVIRQLTGLRTAALELAHERLPAVVSRLRRGEDVDVAAEAPPLSFGTKEIDEVGQAFNAARRTAIQGAVEEAGLRRSISEIFVNLARRSQALLHRQLKLLDGMERKTNEPEALDDLFRLDHLATRMRRHAEGLIILSGSTPGRGWRNPVPVIDVVRAAASEVEDYARVNVETMPPVSVNGPAVADMIHLIAELVENATLFSPPNTPVRMTGDLVGNGFVIEIEDRGLAMQPDQLAAANEQLANPPEFDLSNSARLGLFVVGRLARRHGISVSLRTSPYGGTTAIVLLPHAVIVHEETPQLDVWQRADATRVPALPAAGIRALGGGPRSGFTADMDAMPPDPGPVTGSRPAAGQVRPPRPDPPADTPEDDGGAGTGIIDHRPVTGPMPVAESDGEMPAAGSRPLPRRNRTDRRTPPSASDPVETSPVRVPEPAPEPDAGPVAPSPAENAATDPDGKPRLPRRVKQANLAPQLRADPDAEPTLTEHPTGDRSPEELRTKLSSLQRGWVRGRSDAEQIATPGAGSPVWAEADDKEIDR